MRPRHHLIAAAVFAVVAGNGWAAGDPPYTVVDGNKVDPETLKGFRAWRAAACERCHGANAAGLVGPSLLESLKTLSREEFAKAVLEGRPEKGMPSHGTMKTVVDNIGNLYAYLKGRSDGAIKAGRLEELNDLPKAQAVAEGTASRP